MPNFLPSPLLHSHLVQQEQGGRDTSMVFLLLGMAPMARERGCFIQASEKNLAFDYPSSYTTASHHLRSHHPYIQHVMGIHVR